MNLPDVSPTMPELARAQEVEVETRRPDGTARRTVIWTVRDGERLFVRSYRGLAGRWYLEALRHGRVSLVLGGVPRSFAVRHVDDAAAMGLVSRLFEEKYTGDPSMPDMLRPDVLPTTLELIPEGEGAEPA